MKHKWSVIATIAAIIVAIAVILLIFIKQDESNAAKKYEALKERVVEPSPLPTISTLPTFSFSPSSFPTIDINGKRESDRVIDFEKLKEINTDVIGWISVQGTEINYPVVKSDDNQYYLSHDADREESLSGAIFIDMGNSVDFLDVNTVIYGHNMKNGSMFAQLHNFEDKNFFSKNTIVRFYVPTGMYKYRIFAAYVRNDENVLNDIDFTNRTEFQTYLDNVIKIDDETANISTKKIDANSTRIITLSTCIKGQDERRYIVQAELIN